MQIKIKEVVASYVLDLSGYIVQARITKDISGSPKYLWDVSHHLIDGNSKPVKPAPSQSETIEDALQQLMDYAKVHTAGYSPRENADY